MTAYGLCCHDVHLLNSLAVAAQVVELFYSKVFTEPKDTYSKGTQLGITFASGYIAGVVCAIVSHPAGMHSHLLYLIPQLMAQHLSFTSLSYFSRSLSAVASRVLTISLLLYYALLLLIVLSWTDAPFMSISNDSCPEVVARTFFPIYISLSPFNRLVLMKLCSKAY